MSHRLPAPDVPSRGPGGALARQPIRRVLTALLVVLALTGAFLVIGGMGGLRAAPPKPVPKVAPGTTVDNGRFEIRPLRAWTSSLDPTESDPEFAEKGRFLVVEVRISLTDDKTTEWDSDIPRALALRFPNGRTIDGAKPRGTPARTVLADDLSTAQLHPGLPRKVYVVYEVPGKGAPPASLDLTIYRVEFSSGFLDERKRWTAADEDPVAATVRLPVRKGRP